MSAGILCEPAAPRVDGDGLAFVPPVVPLGFRATAPLLPPTARPFASSLSIGAGHPRDMPCGIPRRSCARIGATPTAPDQQDKWSPRRIVPAAQKYSHMRQPRGGDRCNATTKAGSDSCHHRSATASRTPALRRRPSTEVGLRRSLIANSSTLPNDTRDQMIRAPVSTPARAAPRPSEEFVVPLGARSRHQAIRTLTPSSGIGRASAPCWEQLLT